MTTTQQIQDAQAIARRTMAGTDPMMSWREAGYHSAIEAARALDMSDPANSESTPTVYGGGYDE